MSYQSNNNHNSNSASYTATYSPEDNKLRLYASSRLDSETYARVKSAGFKWAPRRGLFVAPMWTSGREDLLLELCALCHEDKELRDSHYLPRAFYRRSHATVNGKTVAPVVMNLEATMYQAAQVKTYLLCSDCEQRFSKLGETSAGAWSLQNDGTFPLRDLLLQQRPVRKTEAGSLWYFGALFEGFRAEEFNYFAASVFWRGAVHSWTKDSTEPELSLPARAVEDLRQFLLGTIEFPDKMSILLEVHRHPDQMFNYPRGISSEDGLQLTFTVYGLTFYLSIPSAYPDGEPSALSLNRNPFPVTLAEIAENAILANSIAKAGASVQKGKLGVDFPKPTAG